MSAWTSGVELHTREHRDGLSPRGLEDSDVAQCGTCLRKWCYTCNPTPSGRCPFEYDHEETVPEVTDSARLAHAHGKVTQWIASLDANATHDMKRDHVTSARALSARADDLRAVLAILDGSDDDYIRAVGAFRATLKGES